MKTLILLAVFASGLVAASAADIRVQLDVFGAGEVTNLISSYLARELRDLRDVALVDDAPDFFLEVTVALEPGTPARYVVSYAELQASGRPGGPEYYIDGQLFCAVSTLRGVCVAGVAHFDTHVLTRFVNTVQRHPQLTPSPTGPAPTPPNHEHQIHPPRPHHRQTRTQIQHPHPLSRQSLTWIERLSPV